MKKTTTKRAARDDSARARAEVIDLIYQSLETELGGVEVYKTALTCVQNEDLRDEWQEYLEHTQRHVEAMRDVCQAFGLDPDAQTPSRKIVRHHAASLVKAMELAVEAGSPEAAELVAAECVVLAETKDHMNWQLLGKIAETSEEEAFVELADACEEIEDEEDEHLYHSIGWARELWLQSLGLPAELPPPEEEADVKSAAEAASVKKKSEKGR